MILFISDFGGSLPIVYRMKEEGADVKIYIHNEGYRNSYDGIIEKVLFKDLKKMIIAADKVVFDSPVNLDGLADCLENKTVGNSSVFSKYEVLGSIEAKALAKEAGIKIKKSAEGVQLVTEMWFNGSEPVLFSHCLPSNRWLTGDLGIKMGSQSNCLWFKQGSELLKAELESLVPMLTKEKYVGAVSVDCTVRSKDRKPYFNSWKFGFRYDSIFCLLALLGSVSGFFVRGSVAGVKSRDFACSERVTIAPYPYANKSLLLGMAKDVKLNLDLGDMNGFWGQDIKTVEGEVKCAGNDGILGVMATTGEKIEDGFGKIYKSIRKLNVDVPLQFRIDGSKESNKRYKKLMDWELSVN